MKTQLVFVGQYQRGVCFSFQVSDIVSKYGATQCLLQRDRVGNHPVLAAAAWGHHQVLALILAAPGAEKSVTVANRLGEQALVAAATRNNRKCLSKLLACYRPPIAKDHRVLSEKFASKSKARKLLAGLSSRASAETPSPPARGIFRQRGADILRTRSREHKRKSKNRNKHNDSSKSWQHRLIAMQHDVDTCIDDASKNGAAQVGQDGERLKVVNEALVAATKAGSANAMELLLQQDGIDAHIVDDDGQTLAHCAVQSRDADQSLCLLADFSPELLSLADIYGNTPLHHAAAYGFVNSTLVLLQSGVNPHNTNVWGRTPLAIATMAQMSGCMHSLYDYGDDRRAADPAPFAAYELQQRKHSVVIYEDRSPAEVQAKPADMARIMRIWERFFSNAVSGVVAPAKQPEALPEALPERQDSDQDWVEVVSEGGELVYYNTRTEVVQWAVPGREQWEICTHFEDEDALAAVSDEGGHPQRFFFNVITGEEAWELPRWELMQEDGSGEWFFYDTETGECSWEDPNQQQLQEADEWATEEWSVQQDEESGYWYYYNNYTHVSEWAETPESIDGEKEFVTRHFDEDSQSYYWHDASTDVSWWDNGDFDAAYANEHYEAYSFQVSWGKDMYVWEVCKDDGGNEYYFLTNPVQGLEDAVDNSRWLPPEMGWLLRTTPEQDVYYEDIASGDVSWNAPHLQEQQPALAALEDMPSAEEAEEEVHMHSQWESPGSGWLERYSEDDGAVFYEDLETAETAWVLPDGVKVPWEVQAPHLPRSGETGQLVWREEYTEEGHNYFSLLRKQNITTHIEIGYSQLLAAYEQWEEHQDSACMWQPRHDDAGNEFFMHLVTGETSWTRPTEVLATEWVQEDAADWSYLEDEDGNGYWYDSVTGESVWAEAC